MAIPNLYMNKLLILYFPKYSFQLLIGEKETCRQGWLGEQLLKEVAMEYRVSQKICLCPIKILVLSHKMWIFACNYSPFYGIKFFRGQRHVFRDTQIEFRMRFLLLAPFIPQTERKSSISMLWESVSPSHPVCQKVKRANDLQTDLSTNNCVKFEFLVSEALSYHCEGLTLIWVVKEEFGEELTMMSMLIVLAMRTETMTSVVPLTLSTLLNG